MKASGNGTANTCVQNLSRLVRGEVFGDRCRGVDGQLIEKKNVTDELTEDIKWLVDTYEPRVSVEDITVIPDDASIGNYYVDITTKKRGEE